MAPRIGRRRRQEGDMPLLALLQPGDHERAVVTAHEARARRRLHLWMWKVSVSRLLDRGGRRGIRGRGRDSGGGQIHSLELFFSSYMPNAFSCLPSYRSRQGLTQHTHACLHGPVPFRARHAHAWDPGPGGATRPSRCELDT